jgi:hypothetical protein
MEFVEFKGHAYPALQTHGNAAQFAIPFAKQFCKGTGFDIGFCKEEWKFPGAIGIDENLNNGFHAMQLPDGPVDYIFSSHCLEHVDNWVETLEYWMSKLKPAGGIMFLYLPDVSQSYWRPWHNRKHKHCFNPEILKMFFEDHGCKVITSGIDLNNSFMVVAEMRAAVAADEMQAGRGK